MVPYPPPIVEAVLDIVCDYPPGFTLHGVEAIARERLTGDYPTIRHQRLFNVEVQAAPGTPSLTKADNALAALQFQSSDKSRICQIRMTGYSYNRLAPYTSFDEYAPEVFRTWDIFREVANPIEVTAIKMRYINRIPIPKKSSEINLEDYFTIVPRSVPQCDLITNDLFLRHSSTDRATDSRVNIVLASDSQNSGNADSSAFILDLEVIQNVRLPPNNRAAISEKISLLRELKNKIFNNIVIPS